MGLLTNKPTSPALTVDRLPLVINLPTVNDLIRSRYADIAGWMDDTAAIFKKDMNILREGVEGSANTINTNVVDTKNFRVTLDGLSAEIADLGEAIVDGQEAVARRIITVSALASTSTGIKVQNTPPGSPIVGDIWVDNTDPTEPITKEWDGLIWDEVTVPITAAAVADERTARVTADGFLEGKYTLTVVAGDVVTGMNITSASGAGSTISEVTFQADRFKIYNGTSGKIMFDVSATQVRLGGVLVVDTPGQKVFIGTGVWAGATTPWYVDKDGYFSLGDQLYWNPITSILTIVGSIAATTGSIGGFDVSATSIRDAANSFGLSSAVSGADDVRFWAGTTEALRASAPFRVYESGIIVSTSGTIGGISITATALQSTNYVAATSGWYVGQNGLAEFNGVTIRGASTIAGWSVNGTSFSQNNATLSSTGVLTLGTSNDVVILSSVDATYRVWIGNATAGSATFRVTKGGVLTATGATITGDITATTGTIGGWTIGASTLTGGNATLGSTGVLTLGTSNDVVILSSVDATYRLWAGNATSGLANFAVTKTGALFATGATISGAITATSGTIGGWTIGASTLTGGNATLGSTGVLTLGTSNDVVILSSVDATYRLWVGNVASGLAAFAVTKAGLLFATGVTVSGTIIATAGYFGSSTNVVQVNSGGLDIGSSGYVRAGATAYATGTGVWMGYDATAYKIRIGNPSGYQLGFDGSDVVLNGRRVIIGDSTGTSDTVGDLQVVGEISSRKFGAGAVNNGLTVTVAGGSITSPTDTQTGSFAALRLRIYGGGSYTTSASIRLKTAANAVAGGAPTDMEFINTTAALANQYLYFSSEGKLEFAGTTGTRDGANFYRSAANTVKTDGALVMAGAGFSGLNTAGTDFEFQWTRAGSVDVKDVNFRVYSGATQMALIDKNTGDYYRQTVKIIGARDAGWTAQTAVASKADLGAAPTVGQLASWASAIDAMLKTHGLTGT